MPRFLHTRLRFIEPQLPSLVDQPPEGNHWIHEVKHDGYRCIVIVERGGARVYTRNGFDWSKRYPSIVRAATNLRCKSAIIDGEAIVQDDNVPQTSNPYGQRCDGSPRPLSFTPSICCTSTARTSDSNRYQSVSGAVMPDGFDTVVMQEDVRIEEQNGM